MELHYRTFLTALLLVLFAGTAQAASAGSWTPFEPLKDTAADAIDFSWKQECRQAGDADCVLTWKFRNRYRKPVHLTWRLVYRTAQGKQVQQNQATIPTGESTEYTLIGQAIDIVQVGVPKAEVAGVGVISLTEARNGGVEPAEVAIADEPSRPEPVNRGSRAGRAESDREFKERSRQLSEKFAQTRTALKEQEELLRSIVEQIVANHEKRTTK